MGALRGWAVVTVLAGTPDAAVVDFRGLPPARVQATLDAAWPKLEACLTPLVQKKAGTKWSPPVVPAPLPTTQLLTLVVDPGGAVVSAQLEGAGRLDAACAQRALRPLGFERHGVRSTVVKVPVACDASGCTAPWTPAAPVTSPATPAPPR